MKKQATLKDPTGEKYYLPIEGGSFTTTEERANIEKILRITLLDCAILRLFLRDINHPYSKFSPTEIYKKLLNLRSAQRAIFNKCNRNLFYKINRRVKILERCGYLISYGHLPTYYELNRGGKSYNTLMCAVRNPQLYTSEGKP